MPQKPTPEIIKAAILGFEAQKRSIDEQIAELRATLAGDGAEPASRTEPAKRKRRKMSAAGRARIADAQRKRWAGSRKQPEPPTQGPKPKRKLSRAGRAAIVAASKKRWERKRAEAAKAQLAPAKKVASREATAKVARKSEPARKAPKKKMVTAPEVAVA